MPTKKDAQGLAGEKHEIRRGCQVFCPKPNNLPAGTNSGTRRVRCSQFRSIASALAWRSAYAVAGTHRGIHELDFELHVWGQGEDIRHGRQRQGYIGFVMGRLLCWEVVLLSNFRLPQTNQRATCHCPDVTFVPILKNHILGHTHRHKCSCQRDIIVRQLHRAGYHTMRPADRPEKKW